MAEILQKCSSCGAILDGEDLFCGNCGTEAPGHDKQAGGGETFSATNNFNCEGCGASMSYDASAQNLRCPFCGSEKLHSAKDAKVLAPEVVCPFAITREQAEAALKQFMGASFWRPGDLAKTSRVTKLTQVYVPYWIFAATAHTHWTADTSHVPAGARASWYPISGDHSEHYENVLVGASGSLTPAETHALCPFDLRQAVPPAEIDLTNVVFEPFLVQRKYARPQAIASFEQMELAACRELVPGSARNVHVAVLLEGLVSRPVLLPVWIMAYHYRDRTYRFLVNGQTGRHTGEAPFSSTKLAAVIGISVGVLLLIGLAVLICGGLASR